MPKLSIVIPVYNEEHLLAAAFARMAAVSYGLEVEFIMVDDGSTDNSWAVMEELCHQHPSLRLLRHLKNEGKGAALHSGIAAAKGDIIAIQDADLEYDPADLINLIEPMRQNQADVVYGSRFAAGRPHGYSLFRYLVNRGLTAYSNIMSGLVLTDMETCQKVFRADLLQNIPLSSRRFGFEPEVTARLAQLNVRIQEVPISYNPRHYAEGKKIGWRDGLAALWFIWTFNHRPLSLREMDAIPARYRKS